MNNQFKNTIILLVAYSFTTHDVAQASINAWSKLSPQEVVLISAELNQEAKMICEVSKDYANSNIIVADASFMPLRPFPVAVVDMPFHFGHGVVVPFITDHEELMELSDDGNITSLSDLCDAVHLSHGHTLPFEADWRSCPLFLPIASKDPSLRLLIDMTKTKYFIQFKSSCVSPKNILYMRKLFPNKTVKENTEQIDLNHSEPESETPEGEKKEDGEEV